MNIALWIAQVLLALVLGMASLTKLSRPRLALAGMMRWVEDFTDLQVKGIGALEGLAVIGLIVPPLLHIGSFLTPLAAVGVILLMIGAAITHLRRGEPANAAGNMVLLLLAAFIAVGRFGPYHF